MKENTDYELTPSGEDVWNIRILTGEFVETVFKFLALRVSRDGQNLNFNYEIISTPDPDLTTETPELIQVASSILEDVLENAINAKETNDENTDNGSAPFRQDVVI